MPKGQKNKKDSSKLQIILAFLALIGVLGAAIFQNWDKIVIANPPTVDFIGRVSDAKTEKKIRGAKVSLDGQGIPPIVYTDSEGLFTLPLKNSNSLIRIHIDIAGYEKFDRRINPSSKSEVEEIKLDPISKVNNSTDQSPPQNSSSSIALLDSVNYSSIQGRWVIEERVKEEYGGYVILWEYNFTVQDKTLSIKGKKIQVNGKEPQWGEKQAISLYTATLDGFQSKGKFQEQTAREDLVLRGSMNLTFAEDFMSCSGKVYQGTSEISVLTGNKQ